jgi:hypothetical protein
VPVSGRTIAADHVEGTETRNDVGELAELLGE